MKYSNVNGTGRGDGEFNGNGNGVGFGHGNGSNGNAIFEYLNEYAENELDSVGDGRGYGIDGGVNGNGGFFSLIGSFHSLQPLGLWFENHSDIQSSVVLLALSSILKRPHHRV